MFLLHTYVNYCIHVWVGCGHFFACTCTCVYIYVSVVCNNTKCMHLFIGCIDKCNALCIFFFIPAPNEQMNAYLYCCMQQTYTNTCARKKEMITTNEHFHATLFKYACNGNTCKMQLAYRDLKKKNAQCNCYTYESNR